VSAPLTKVFKTSTQAVLMAPSAALLAGAKQASEVA